MALSVDDARALHEEVPVIDLHADTPMLMRVLGYDLSARHDLALPSFANYIGHVDVPRMREGRVAAQFFGMWTVPYPESLSPGSIHNQLDSLDAAIDSSEGNITRCFTAADVRAAQARGSIAALSGIEGAHALAGDAARVEEFARRGVRYIGLLHFSANQLGAPAYGRGADSDRGLSAHGHDVVAEMNRLGVVVDLAHINRKGFFEALELASAPPMVSHTGVRGVHDHWRNIDDDQIRAVADRGGCVGIIFSRRFLGGRGLDAVCDHLLHVIDVAGEDVPALGSDFDGFVVPPDGLEDVSRVPHLTARLSERGVSDRALRKLLGENAMRVLADNPPAAAVAGAEVAS